MWRILRSVASRSRVATCGWALLAVASAAAALATPAPAITRGQANRIALKALGPGKSKQDRVVVFGLSHALSARATVVEAGASPGRPKVTRNGRVGQKAWLFWEDLS